MRGTIRTLIGAALLCSSALHAQDDFIHPELNWRTIRTKHFLVHFHDGEQRTGSDVARIAESIYTPITSMYSHEPDQAVSIVIRDHDDYSNGAAYFYDNKIEIWAPSLDFELRGTHPWLLNVVTHEFTHIIQMQTSMKLGRKFPAVYLQWLGYEEERRPDVLYGFPNVLVSYPLSGFVVPSWFAEGVAQYNHPDLEYDTWDSHRDMILRMYLLEGQPLSWEEMAVFGKTSLGNESSYNAGFSIVDFIAKKYGNEKIVEISKALAAPGRLTIGGAVESVLGISGEQLYQQWMDAKRTEYTARFGNSSQRQRDETIIEHEGFGNFYPAFSPDGKKLAYVSNKGSDFFGLSSVYVFSLETKTAEKLDIVTRSTLSFSPDGNTLYYSKSTRENPHWSSYSDLYRYDIAGKKETRLTYGWRAFNPSLSSDGTKLVFVTGSDGTLNLAVCDTNARDFQRITHFANGEQAYTPVWSHDGAGIAFGYSVEHDQSVATVDAAGSNLRILGLSGDARNPRFSQDGKRLFFSWDSGGVFNIYATEELTGSVTKVTDVLGGAFLPAVSPRGDLAYASYKGDGYKIGFLSHARLDSALAGSSLSTSLGVKPLPPHSEDHPTDSSFSYRSIFSSISIIPFLRYDNYNASASGWDVIKPGLFFVSTEMLDKLSLFGSVAMNQKFERDLYLSLEYNDKLPLLYQIGLEPKFQIEMFNVTRNLAFDFELYTDRLRQFHTEIQFNLLEFDFSFGGKLLSERLDAKVTYSLSRYSQDFGHWLYRNDNQVPALQDIAGSRAVYLISNTFAGGISYDGIERSVDQSINPVGRTVRLKYTKELNQFNPKDSAEFKNGLRVPLYTLYDIDRVELQWTEHLRLPFRQHTLSVGLKGGSILGTNVDDFFDFYAGGLFGMRGYSFYALGGNEYAALNVTYRFPLATKLETRILQFYFTKLYASFFADIGHAWNGATPPLNAFRKDAGFELRLESFSFYSYPTRLFFSGAYGFDQFSKRVNDVNVVYGKEWRWYFGVLFDFEFGNVQKTIREWR